MRYQTGYYSAVRPHCADRLTKNIETSFKFLDILTCSSFAKQRVRVNGNLFSRFNFYSCKNYSILQFATWHCTKSASSCLKMNTFVRFNWNWKHPPRVNATTEGVVLAPSAFSMTLACLPSMTATQELVVPRSMPTTAPDAFPSLRWRKLPSLPKRPCLWATIWAWAAEI